MAALSVWFWNERFWLPHNVTWADLADPAPGVEYPKAGHLLSALPLAVGIFAVRILFERFIASPCAFLLHIHAASVHWRATPNPVLEKVFTSITKSLSYIFRWRLIFYLFMFTYGICFLWKCSWMWDTHHCWYNYPYQVLTPGLYHYYVTELGFYWSLMFSQFTDIKRKDFPIMFIHHLATVSLISFSYANNMLRVGSLVMCVHDASDFLLEAAKLANYAKYQHLCDFLFVLFAVVFFITRLVLYPLWILNTTLFESWEIIGPYPSWWLFNSLLLVLQVLHVIWSYLIAGIAYKALVRGKVSKDDRSDVESSSEEEVDTNGTNAGGLTWCSLRKVENGTKRPRRHYTTWPQQIRSSSSSR
ncbi:ceramide synthase 5 [Salvelinus sp. IW2-2015]|uniref:ceramide synthase 5 n=1 Tax=Salvelinus sp. IW2-2015 TaxID=2691554 RepID=UPI0038D3A10C